jgi:hypothetical protein
MEWLRVGLVEELWLRSFGRNERGPQDDAGRLGRADRAGSPWETEEHRGDGQANGWGCLRRYLCEQAKARSTGRIIPCGSWGLLW